MSSFLASKKTKSNQPGKKLAVFLLVIAMLFSSLFISVRPALAIPTEETLSIPQVIGQFLTRAWDVAKTAIQKAGSIAFQRTLASALNKIAYDSANYLGSGGKGQKPLFVTQSLGDYLKQAGDEAAGTFIESFVNNLNTPDRNMACQDQYDAAVKDCATEFSNDASSYRYCIQSADEVATACASKTANSSNVGNVTPSFNVCSPSSLEAKIKIGLGLVDQNRPQGPNCTASQMIKSWGDDINKKLADLRDPNYLDEFTSIFDPRSNDLGIYVTARSDLSSQANIHTEVTKSDFITKGGFLDVRDISGAIQGVPGEAQREADAAAKARQDALGKTTGDILIDSANIFLNQLYVSAFNNLLQNLAKKSGSSGSSYASSNYESDPNVTYGESAVKEVTSSLLQPKFGVRTDYDILSSLAICPDPKNPGPDNCVIDDKFMQAIAEKKTVAEAIQEGYLHEDWPITADSSGSSYNSSYSLRNIMILRAHRIVPAGWEEAAKKLVENDPPRKATLRDLVSCFDKNDQYNTFSTDFQPDRSWCEGLVDPNWVLKSPLNYCAKEGVGAQILNTMIVPGATAASSTVNITRADNYCADNQTCIVEKSDGSCESYGYCNEEKRTWNFGTDACQSINNTCQSFSDPSGRKVSYLKNTLNYGNCNPENSGCRQYSLFGAYATSTGTVSWSPNQIRYLNKNLSSCTGGDDGCTSLLRVKPTWGANLIMDADFTNDQIGDSSAGAKLNDWPIAGKASIVDASSEPGGASGKALKLTETDGPAGIYSDNNYSLLPNNFQAMPGQAYTLSADIYIMEGGDVSLAIGPASDGFTQSTGEKNSWQHLSVTRAGSASYNEAKFSVTGNPASAAVGAKITFYLKNLKFEMSDWDTGYSSYGASKFYEKILPPYLEKTCYVDATSATKNYNLKTGAPAVCSNYARKCNQSEVGCELYTAVKDKFAVGAKVTSADYCAADCLGYDVYISKASYFNSPSADNLIPDKATTCSATAVGCNEFTNLDALNQGGEQKEYYTQLKQCIKPSQASCANFYSWEGTANGYQLKAYSLEKTAASLPAVTADDSQLCNAAIYHLSVYDPGYNPDCREFYNVAGEVSYHLNSRTITCSDNCHAYRMSEKNIDRTIATQAGCQGSDKHWDNTNNNCVVCLNGGTWDLTAGACIYQAIPGEGQTCQANEKGCREYNGNNGNNVRLAAYYDFENGLGDWTSPTAGGISISSVANSNNGHSLRVAAGVSAQLAVGNIVSQGSAYTLKFLARAASDSNLTISFVNPATGASTSFSAVKVRGGNDWNIYQANLSDLDHAVALATTAQSGEILAVSGTSDFYLDDFVLSEVIDRYYLIKGSSQIPDVCYYDNFNHYQGADYNLGCAQYTDRGGLKHNLHNFTQLCSDSAVGCEQMIDTKNYLPYGAGFWENGVATSSCPVGSDPNCVKVDGDSAFYAVYDNSKLCGAASQGCSRLGEGQGGANFTGWSDVFKNNNPDQYSTALCSRDNVGCEAWKSAEDASLSYFKDPGTATCIYRVSNNSGLPGKRWYKIPVKRCDLNGNGSIDISEGIGKACNADADCGAQKCLIDNNDYECPVSYLKTIGSGGADVQIPTPQDNAGLCDAGASTCSEYIDPVSRFSPNLVANPNYQCAASGCDGWGGASPEKWQNVTPASDQQVIKLQPYTLYSLQVDYSGSANTPVGLDFLADVLRLDNNVLANPAKHLEVNNDNPLLFYSSGNTVALVSGGKNDRTISVKTSIVSYQLQKNLEDTCNGQTKYDNGCILFNERSINGASGPANLNWDAYATEDGKTPVLCSATGSCTANKLVKVRPDRVCAQWLDCTSYVLDPVTKKKTCYSFAQCDRLDNKGECADFVNQSSPTYYFNPKVNQNATGYSLVDKYSLSAMGLVGQTITIDGSFDNGNTGCLNSSTATLIDNPEAAKNETDYPADGKGYLKVPDNGTCDIAQNISVKATPSDQFFINYLVNTKNAGGGSAMITITDDKGTLIKLLSQSPTGWERKIQRFNLSVGQRKIKITLGADPTAPSTGSVYFDDINIEPVLKISSDNYAAPECRLYPTSDSLTCLSKNKNVVSEGLYGYCLEHDPLNKNVCLLWYPMDNIPLPSMSTMGYSGDFPVNYCTAVSGNFDLMEKRRAYRLNGFDDDALYVYNENGDFIKDLGDPVGTGCNGFSADCYGCFKFNTTGRFAAAVISSSHGALACPADYDMWISSKECNGGSCQDHYNFMCIPKADRLELIDNPNANYGDSVNGGNWELCQNSGDTYKTGYAKFNGFAGHEADVIAQDLDPNPNLKIADRNNVVTTDSLKLIPGTSSIATTSGAYFHIACSQLVQTVNNNGVNAAWVNRVAPGSSFSLASSSPFFAQNYTQSMEKPPFGAANSIANIVAGDSLLTLKDMAKTDLPYAGRPYGCINGGTAKNCSLIGSCSGAPNTYCLATSSSVNISAKTCGTSGPCQPLWVATTTNITDYANVLKNIFLKATGYLVKGSSQTYVNQNIPFDFTLNGLSGALPHPCPGGVRPATDFTKNPEPSFCAIFPKLDNINLYYNDSKTTLTSNNTYDVKQKGIYRLEFTSKVDPEQEPLKQISIKWGDGYEQIVTNQDDHPNSGDPHVFYHYYGQIGPKNIIITITDNWDFYVNN